MEYFHNDHTYARINRAVEAHEDAKHSPEPSNNSMMKKTKSKRILERDTRASTTNRVGLVNLSNTCYMNSVLQALFMTKRFCDSILGKHQFANSPTLDALQVLFGLLLHSENHSVSPDAIWNLTNPTHFQKGRQQDSYEYLLYFLDMVEKEEKNERFYLRECTASCSSSEESSAKFINQTEQVSCMDRPNEAFNNSFHKEEAREVHEIGNETPSDDDDHGLTNAHEIFCGEMKITYSCVQCNSQSAHKERFRDIHLGFPKDIAQNKKPIFVQDLLDAYLKPEELQGDNLYMCSTCRDLKEGLKTIEICCSPSHLIIILKVFTYENVTGMRKKLKPKVQCSKNILISAFDKKAIKDEKYDLYAIVAHKGGCIDSGHYVSYARDASNTWYFFNDELVEETTFESVTNMSSNYTPFMLFYQKTTEKFQVGVKQASLTDLKPHLVEMIQIKNLQYRDEIQSKKKKCY